MVDLNPQLAVKELVLVSDDKGRVLLDGVSVTIGPNQRVGLVGASGSGKTLLARSLIGFLPRGVQQTSGQIGNNPELVSLQPGKSSHRFSTMVPQFPANALPQNTGALQLVRDVVAWTSGTARRDEWKHASRFLDSVDLKKEMRRKCSHQLSGGMAMRVAMATNSQFLILDEPTSGLAPVSCRSLAKLLMTISQPLVRRRLCRSLRRGLCTTMVLAVQRRETSAAPQRQPASRFRYLAWHRREVFRGPARD